MAMLKKITYGFVVQSYSETSKVFVHQEFIAGEEVEWETCEGRKIETPDGDPYLNYNMVQPKPK